MTTLTHMGITTQAALCARAHLPALPDTLIWHFLPRTSGIWLRSCFEHDNQAAALDIIMGFLPPSAKWHILVFKEDHWPDVLAEGCLTEYLP